MKELPHQKGARASGGAGSAVRRQLGSQGRHTLSTCSSGLTVEALARHLGLPSSGFSELMCTDCSTSLSHTSMPDWSTMKFGLCSFKLSPI